jgi:hypothetical protein
MNFPTIQRYAPLIHGEHCFYYAIEGDNLLTVVQAALSDKARLREMALVARQHVLEHHTCERVGNYVLMESLSARSASLSPRSLPAAEEASVSHHLVRHSLETRDEGGSEAKVSSP